GGQLVATAERAYDVRAAERGMPRERHLEGWREDPHVRGGAHRRQDECRLREIELEGQRLHGRTVDPATVLEHRERVACERLLGEDVDDAKRVVGHGLATGSSASKSARTSRASEANAAGVTSRASTTRGVCAAGKLRSSERA